MRLAPLFPGFLRKARIFGDSWQVGNLPHVSYFSVNP
jgi:hypothetical protein